MEDKCFLCVVQSSMCSRGLRRTQGLALLPVRARTSDACNWKDFLCLAQTLLCIIQYFTQIKY